MEEDTKLGENSLVVDAQEVYLLLNDVYRTSRFSRVNWYFDLISSRRLIEVSESKQNDGEDLQILSIRGSRALLDEMQGIKYHVTPATTLFFLARSYSFVYVLDMSPSINAVDLYTSCVLYEQLFGILQKSLKALIKPFQLPGGSSVRFVPKIYLTIVAHSSIIGCKANQVLLQGCLMSEDNLDSILDQLRRDLEGFESQMANSFQKSHDLDYLYDYDDKITFGLFEDLEDHRLESPDPTTTIMSPSASFINMLRYGILALQLLPENSMSGIIVITDGIVGVPEHSLFESLMMQLRHNMISCSFLQLGDTYQYSGLGHIPYPELMQFIATSTMGMYFPSISHMDLEVTGMTSLQEAVLNQRLVQTGVLSMSLIYNMICDLPRLQLPLREDKAISMVRTRKHKEKNLHVPLTTILTCRIREGFFINEVTFTKGESQVEVRLLLPWREAVNIHCTVISPWPLSQKSHCHMEISVEGTYDFITDITSPSKQKGHKNSYRTGLVQTYWETMKRMSESDEMLIHLQAFNTNINYKVPESLKQGVPLFYLPPNQNSPQINIQLSTKENSFNQFATYWRKILNLDINQWQKWMHIHRIGFILEHDVPVGKHLHIPNSSGRFHNATCRLAFSSVSFFLRDYSTFVLMENHSYVTLLSRDPDRPPWSFFVIRITSKPPCMVLRLAFFGNTPGLDRNEIITDLKKQLLTLRFRCPIKDDHAKVKLARRGSKFELELKPHAPPLQRQSSKVPCCILTSKPVEKILIRYTRMPTDFLSADTSPQLERNNQMMLPTANRLAFSIYTTLSRYLFHRRWIWAVQHGSSNLISMQAIGRILSNLTKIRLQEGFNFAHTSSGIVNLTVELDMKGSDHEDNEEDEDNSDTYPCVLQYVVFPPHTVTNKGSEFGDDGDDIDTAEADGELQIITECWIESQWGVVVQSTPERKHFDGLNYQEVTQTMFPTDLDCISTMITFEHLNLMCQSTTVPSPAPNRRTPLPNASHDISNKPIQMSSEISIQTVPFPFDLMRLLPKCQQVELLFSTFIEDFHLADEFRRRSGTLTAEESYQGKPSHTNQKFSFDVKSTPNAKLFQLFLESLQEVHQREIELTDFECEQLISLIQQRDRDLEVNPLPFAQRQTCHHNHPHGHQVATEQQTMDPYSESIMSLMTNLSMASPGFSQGTVSTLANNSFNTGSHRIFPSSVIGQRINSPVMRDLDAESTKTPTTITSSQEGDREKVRVVPRWRCFVRSLNTMHIMLCFAPASLEDLLMLVDVSDSRDQRSKSVSSKRSSFCDRSCSFSIDGKSVDKSEPLSPQVEGEIYLSRNTSQFDHAENEVDLAADSEPDSQQAASLSRDEENDDVSEQEVTEIADVNQNADQSHEMPTLNADNSPESLADACPDIPKDGISLTLPCYVYNCPLSFLSEQLVNKWTFAKPEDIYEDLTFGSQENESPRSNATEKEETSTLRPRRISELELGKRDGQKDDVYKNTRELKQHCTMISETYLRCFVKGLYQGLQQGYPMDSRDVDAAINEICEESLPLEIDLSRFLHCCCGHVRKVIEYANLERIMRDDWSRTQPKAGDDADEDNTSNIEEESRDVGQTPLHFALNGLKAPITCEASPNLHKHIRAQFEKILHQYFKPVQNTSDFYIFSGQCFDDSTNIISPRDFSEVGENTTNDREHKVNLSGDSTIMYDIELQKHRETYDRDDVSIMSNKNSMSSLSQGDVDDFEDLEEAELDTSNIDCQPLFVHLACSVRAKSSTLRSMPIKNIPTCFNEIEECLQDIGETVDLRTLHVTLDIICLTLPAEEDLVENFHRPCYQRMTSHTSQMSNNPSEDQDYEDVVCSISDGGFLQRSTGGDPLHHLPQLHRKAIRDCRDQVLWLLSDEIASTLRSVVPVTLETLEMVSKHIRVSHDNPMCCTKHVPLKFVGSAAQSLQMFIEDFERMNLPGFHLNREGSYYYLSVDRAFGFTQAHAKALQNALNHIDMTDIKDIALMAAIRKDHEGDSVIVLQGNRIDIQEAEDESTYISDSSVGKGCEGPKRKRSSQTKETDTFRAEDIRISVTRPSPVKELHSASDENAPILNLSDLVTQQDATERGYLSDMSSGSSIQVLDEKPEQEHKGGDVEAKPDDDLSVSQNPAPDETSKEDNQSEMTDPQQVHSEIPPLEQHSRDQSSRNSSGSKSQDMKCPDIAEDTPRSLSPLTLMLLENAKKSIRRAHSSASFEKYKAEKAKKIRPAGYITPQRRSSANQTPSRSRHHSGLEMVPSMSTMEYDSRCSLGDDGYEGDSSDLEDDGAMLSFNDTQTFCKPVLPGFWLILKIEKDHVNVFFHTRDSGEENSAEQIVNYKMLYNQMIVEITQTCRVVNQRMLLERLYNSRMCDKLLVPEADEDVCWGSDTKLLESKETKLSDDLEMEEMEDQEKVYFDAARDTDPGHFACDCVWQTQLHIQSRLKTGPGRRNIAGDVGIQTLRSSVLNKFSVNNRKNMFVIKESSTGSVFYLRLEETSDVMPTSMTDTTRLDEEFSSSRSSSIWSLRKLEPEDDQQSIISFRLSGAFDKSEDLTSIDKKAILHRQRSEDIITLSAYGICPVGLEISKDLKELLQKKLDDAVLKILTEIMVRNPMCKLTEEDVRFIQRPFSSPLCKLAYTIPSSALLHKFALKHYLQQNLLQFVHTPKYIHTAPEHTFQDYTSTPPVPIEEDSVFIYNRPQQSGNNGIGCIYLSFVDSTGEVQEVFSCPKPSCLAYKDYLDSSMFPSLVHSERYEIQGANTKCRTPGPMGLVQFTVWAQGAIDIGSLSDQLLVAINHAAADVITEYRLLTAPICEPPVYYYKGLDTPTSSAPPSPIPHFITGNPGAPTEYKHQVSEGSEKPKDKISFSIHSIMSDIFLKTRDKESQPTSEETRTRAQSQRLLDKIQQFEIGDKGELVPLLHTTLINWLQFCHSLKMPAVTKQKLALTSRFPLDYILKDMSLYISTTCQDILPKLFKMITKADGQSIYVPYVPPKSRASREKESENVLDPYNLQTFCPQYPGSTCNFIMIGRNIKQWRYSIDYGALNNSMPSLKNPKTNKSYQKFKPLEKRKEPIKGNLEDPVPPEWSDQAFAPRQRLLMINFQDKEISLYLYNWTNELCTGLERQLLRFIQWHNARSQLLLGIFSQKMGLYQHNMLRGIPVGEIPTARTAINPFSQSHSEVDLIKYTSPPLQKTPQSRPRSIASRTSLLMDDIFRDTKPTTPMHRSSYAHYRDPVHRHGAQLLEHYHFEKRENELIMGLQKLYVDWQQRVHSNMHIPEEVLDHLKRSSRLIHTVTTPVLFSTQWRKKILGKKDPPKPAPMDVSKQPRSRHSSGASVRSRRSNSVDGRNHELDVSTRALAEVVWHVELREAFTNQYRQYLQELGLHLVKTNVRMLIQRPNPQNQQQQVAPPMSRLKPDHLYMQKTLPGGVMLVEMGFQEEFFCVNIYALAGYSLPMSKNVNPQLTLIFNDECERMKDLTHLHSFSHNFHLSTILKYIHGRHQGAFSKSHFHVINFLKDFVQVYPTMPNNTQNMIHEGSIVIEDTHIPSQQLFEYMLQHDRSCNMQRLKMHSHTDDIETDEHALVMLINQPSRIAENEALYGRLMPQDYSLGLIIAHDDSQRSFDTLYLRLKFWVILINEKSPLSSNKSECKNKLSKVTQCSAVKSSYCAVSREVDSSSGVDLVYDPQMDTVEGVMSAPLLNTDYLGYCNSHQVAAFELLMKEVSTAREHIRKMVAQTITHCRRDVLWQRMLLGEMAEEEGKRKRHRTGEPMDMRDLYMTKLSFHEFQEMLDMVYRVRISEMDPNLKPLESMSAHWYQGLSKVLIHKYGESLRSFFSADGLVQYYLVLNPNQLDMLMMLSIDTLGEHNDLCFVYKERDQNLKFDSPIILQQFESFINTCCFHMWTGLI